MEAKDKIIVVLDGMDIADNSTLRLVSNLSPHVGYFKVGLENLTRVGAPKAVQILQGAGAKIFFDGKFKDIPNTVYETAKVVTSMGVDMFNVHCLGGEKMMKEARRAAEEVSMAEGKPRPIILGVTILTSLDYDDLVKLGIFREVNIADPKERAEMKSKFLEQLVAHDLAWLAQESGLDGVIASPLEIGAIREYCQPELLVVTPDVRPLWAAVGDQKRVMTPCEAIKAGADYLVIDRPITNPPPKIGGPVEAAKKIAEEIEAAEEAKK